MAAFKKTFRRKFDRFALRQGVLTVGERVCSSVLEGSEGGVGLECLRDVLGALCTELVVTQTAIESKTQTSGGADTFVQKRAQNDKPKVW